MPRSSQISASPLAFANPVRTRGDWEEMRSASLADPGAFHGDIAAGAIHWLAADMGEGGAWLSRDEAGMWRGWDARTAQPVSPTPDDGFLPWKTAFDASAPPHWR